MAESAHRLNAAAKVEFAWAEVAPGRWRAIAQLRSTRERAFENLTVLGYDVLRDEDDDGFVLEVRT